MAKLYSGQKIIKALIRAGFYIVSTKGSHVKLRGIRFGKLQTVIVPKHSILKQAAIDFDELRKFIK